MTDKAIRTAIAEVCGWQHVVVNSGSTGRFLKGSLIGTDPTTERTTYVPDYLNDLNAVREAWLTLTNGERFDFRVSLVDVLGSGDWYEGATAEQHCEAFLRVKGLWKESAP